MKDEIKKGAFHKWLGKSPNEKITASDISKGLASDSEHVRKMAQFAKNMQHIQEDTMTGLTNLIKLANDKNPTEFKSVFNDLMGSRLRDALEIRRVEIASSICQESTTTPINEGVRKVGQYNADNGHVTKIHYDSDASEYKVSLHKPVNGKLVHHEPADYFASDKKDAHETAKHILKHLGAKTITESKDEE